MRKDFFKYFIPILLLSIIGLITIYLSKSMVNNYLSFFKRQVIFLVLGICLLFFFKYINFNYIKKYSLVIYIISNLLLIYVLLFGSVINGSKCWINVFGITIQPSEFAKIGLLLCLDKYIKSKYGILKGIILLLIPSILTFLEPDTGTVLFYLVIFFSIFISLNLNKKYYISLFACIGLVIIIFLSLYFFNSNLFIKIFGTSFFYRMDRIINFIDNEGYQISNALTSIGNGGLIGNLGKYVIYIPEAITDFMFANVLTIFGFIGGIFILMLFLYLDIKLLSDIFFVKKNKFYVIGLFGLFLYQQIQHIFMDIGLFPITGITLPFVSYGGSSLISYYILFGLLLNIKKYQIDT